MDEDDERNNLSPQPAGIVSRIVNFVVNSSPIRGSSSNSCEIPVPKSSPLALDEEISAVNRKLKSNIHLGNINFQPTTGSSKTSLNRSFSGETGYFTPETSSLESISNNSSFVANEDVEMTLDNEKVHRTSNEELQKLNEVLQMTEITESPSHGTKNFIPRTNSLESAVKIELLQEEVATLQNRLSNSSSENRELRSLVEEYETAMSLIIGILNLNIFY